jgi:receptor protein-tyrosine kinase
MRILWRHKAALLLITSMGGLAAAVLTSAQPRVYQSRALVEFRILNQNFLNLRNIYAAVELKIDPALYLQTQAELLQQDSLIKQVAQKLHLAGRPEFQPPSSLLGKLREEIAIMPLRNTRILQIVCDARDPSLAADMANTLARTFIEQNIATRQQGARQTYESLQSQLENMKQSLPEETTPESKHRGLGRVGRPLTPGAGANQHIYRTMLQLANDARTASAVPQSEIELISPAEPPTRPQKPNQPLLLGMGILDGLVLAIGFIMLQEQRRAVLRMPGEAESLLALPELGAIPSAGSRTPTGLGSAASGSGKLCVEKAVLEYQSSWVAESFRCALTSILSSNGDYPRIVVVTSSRPMEGKTTAVSNLGCALAEIGRKTLLIDGDLRHPQLQRIFDEPSAHRPVDWPGQTNAADLPLDAFIKKTAVPHLFVLACGAQADAILGLAHSERMSRLFERFREEFDHVLIDTPPCLEFPGARNLARSSDGVVVVLRANYTDRSVVRAAVERFEDDGIRVMGVILNDWNPRERALPGFHGARSKFGRVEL